MGLRMVCVGALLAVFSGIAAGFLDPVTLWLFRNGTTVASDVQQRFKEVVPVFGGVIGGAGFLLADQAGQQIHREKNGVALAQWIRESRRSIPDSRIQSIPEYIRKSFSGFYSPAVLDTARYTIGAGNDLAVPANVFRAGMAAVVLDNVIVFRDSDQVRNILLWAHELKHVEQYRRWGGIDQFATRYASDPRSVENEADESAERYRLENNPVVVTGTRTGELASCTPQNPGTGFTGLTFWGPKGDYCNREHLGRYGNSASSPATLCSCTGRGGLEGVRLWGPQGQACAGISTWGTYSEQCVPAKVSKVCGCPGKGNSIAGHAIWGPAGQPCGGFVGWGVYEQACMVIR